jgi:hypothetical protein
MDEAAYRKRYLEDLEKAAEERPTFRDVVKDSKAAGRLAAGRPRAGRVGTGRPTAAPAARGLEAAGEEGVAAATAPGAAGDVDLASAIVGDDSESVDVRVASIREIGTTIARRPDLMEQMLAVLRDASQPQAVRLEALAALEQAAFQPARFRPLQPAYFAALRELVDDRDSTVRRRAIGVLARERDEYVQRRLTEQLESGSRTLVSTAKAIQFLAYDPHALDPALLKRIIADPPSRAAKEEAVRALAADPGSADYLAGLLRDRQEAPAVRNLSAVALQSLDPGRFEAIAREIVQDEDEDDAVRATCLNALTVRSGFESYATDETLTKGVEQLQGTSKSPKVRRMAKAFLDRSSR